MKAVLFLFAIMASLSAISASGNLPTFISAQGIKDQVDPDVRFNTNLFILTSIETNPEK